MSEETNNTKSFNIERLYVKEQSCKIPHGQAAFIEMPNEDKSGPKTNIEMNMRFDKLDNNRYEALLQMQISSKLEERTLYNAEIHQAGVFKIQGFSEEELPILLNVHCPQVLFPYLRKTLADMVQAAGFAPLVLNPISFEGLYQQKQQQAQATDTTRPMPTAVSDKATTLVNNEISVQ